MTDDVDGDDGMGRVRTANEIREREWCEGHKVHCECEGDEERMCFN